jgi:glycosyltransferase involved in cell wall biosynthesis
MLTKTRIKVFSQAILNRFPVTKRILVAITLYFRTRNRKLCFLPDEASIINFDGIAPRKDPPKLFFDISALYLNNETRGIHRVVRKVLDQLLLGEFSDFEVVTVRSTRNGLITCAFNDCAYQQQNPISEGEDINAKAGDIFLSLDLYKRFNFAALQRLSKRGLKVYFVVHDLLDIRTCCLGENDPITKMIARIARRGYNNWLHGVLSLSDGIICVSYAVVNDLLEHLSKNANEYQRKIKIGFFHLGADIISSDNGNHSVALDPSPLISDLKKRPSFLMVGVMDPHKGHRQAIQAFEQLWHDGVDVNLVIVGKEGILEPYIGQLIINHKEFGHRLYWLGFVSDDLLLSAYETCTALLAASFSEGFGLPLIEAAHHGLPIIARDIPIFREVASTYAFYFKNNDASDIAEAIKSWLSLAAQNKIPYSRGMPYMDWAASTRQLINIIKNDNWCAYWGVEESALPKFNNERIIITSLRNDQ